jgi:large subunit ribosomal protein L33
MYCPLTLKFLEIISIGVFTPMASKREKIKLKSSESTFFYYTVKNRSKTPDRLTLRKYDPTLRKHVEFKETK